MDRPQLSPQFELQQHVDYLYAHAPRQLAFRATTHDEFSLWQAALRNIVPDELFPRLAACVDETAAKYEGERTPVLIRSA